MSALHQVRISPLPAWVDLRRLLGPTAETDPTGAGWEVVEMAETAPGGAGARQAQARLSTALAADLAARLRGMGLDGQPLTVAIEPPLRRPAVRRARTQDARRRRQTTPGFERPGVRLDDEGRWSLTPEILALRVAAWAAGRPVVDAGCGVGGNAIAFARAGCPVVAIEADGDRLALARHNAGVYGVADRIRFVHADARALAPTLAREVGGEAAILFVDPPWGPQWSRERTGLDDLPLLASLLPIAAAHYGGLWAKLPPSFVGRALPGAEIRALFGEAEGDRRRIKFLLAMLDSKVAEAQG